jgi:hypothetical protein
MSNNDIPYEPIKQPGCLDKVLIALMMVISAIFFRHPKRHG